MRFAVVAHRQRAEDTALVSAAAACGLEAGVLEPRRALRLLEPGDVALARLDVRAGLDGIESGTPELERLAAAGVDVLNPPGTLVAAHDKLLTARALRLAGLPHPHTSLIAEGLPAAAPELPLVLKPRFGADARGIEICRTADELAAALERAACTGWFREHGAVAQELVPPFGPELRVAVAGGRVVGAEQWVAGDARRAEPAEPPPLARTLATAAAAAIRGDLVGVDLLPTSSGYVVLDLNPAADLGLEHAGACADVVAALLRTPAERRAAVALGA